MGDKVSQAKHQALKLYKMTLVITYLIHVCIQVSKSYGEWDSLLEKVCPLLFRHFFLL